MATANGSPRARALAAALKKARLDRSLSGRRLAEIANIDQSLLSKIENGQRIPNVETTARILGALHVPTREYERIIDLARNADEPNWLTVGVPGIPQPLAGVVESERAANAIVEWSLALMPGLSQTSDYVRAMTAAIGLPNHEAESRVMIRAARREILTNRNPVQYDMLLDETALVRPIAPPDVMTDQLRHLLELGGRPNVTLRIVPYRVPFHPGTVGPFVLYSFPDAPPFVHFENHSSGAFVADSEDVGAYRKAIDLISSYALSPEESAELIGKTIVKEWSP